MVQNTSNAPTNSLSRDLKLMMAFAFIVYLMSMVAFILTSQKMERISRQGYIHKFMTRHFNEHVGRISEDRGIEPPYMHFMVSAESAKPELEKCNIVPQPKMLLYACKELQTIYVQGQVIESIERELGRSLVFPMSYEALPNKYLYFIAELGIAKYIASTKQQSSSPVDRATLAYCLLGQSSYASNSGSSLKREEILESHVRITNFVAEDISPRQQLIAFKRGWSGKSCY